MVQSAADILPVGGWVFLLVLGPALGSFLAVLADRLPRGEDVIRAPSRCRSCGQGLRAWDLVPILSFLCRRGRCGHCQARIPPWSLYLEIAMTGVILLALLSATNLPELICTILFLGLLLTLASCDILWLRLPDVLTAALFLVALVLSQVSGGGGVFQLQDLGFSLLAAGIGAGSFMLLRLGYRALRGREGLGLGDIKLMLGLGAYAGLYDLPLLVLMGAVLGLGAALLQILWQRLRRSEPAVFSDLGQQILPFGASLCAAAALLWLLRVMAVLPPG